MSLLVQASAWSAQYTATGGTQTLPSAPTTAHRVVVKIILNNNFTPGVCSGITDNQGVGNVFYALKQEPDGESGDNCSVEMWTCDSMTYNGVSPYTVEVASPVTNNYNILVEELLPCTVDQQGSAGTTNFPITATCAHNNTYVPGIALGVVSVAYGATSVTDPPTGYTSLGVPAAIDGYTEGEACYRDLSAIERSSITWTWVTGENGAAIVQTFTGLHPTITAQPQNETAAVGATQAFSLTATSSGGTLTYQWYSAPITSLYENVPGSWSSISGATSSSYTTPTLSSSSNGLWYYCAVTDSNGTVNSTAVRGWVTGLPSAGKGLLLKSSWPLDYRTLHFSHTGEIVKKTLNFGETDQIGSPLWTTWLLGTSGGTGSAAITEGHDTAAGVGSVAVAGAASITDTADVVAATGGVAVTGAAAITETSDTVAAAGGDGVSGTAAISEASDTVAATGGDGVSGSAAITEGADVVAATGSTSTSAAGIAAITETPDVVSAAGGVSVSGAAAITEGSDAVAAAGGVAVTGAAAITEGPDAAAGVGKVAVTGAAAITETPDVVAGAGQPSVSGSAAIHESSDIVSATGIAGGGGVAAITESADVVAGTGGVGVSGTATLAEGPDVVMAAGDFGVTGAAPIVEGADVAAASGGVGVTGTVAATEGDDVVTATGTATGTAVSGDGAIQEGTDVVAASGITSLLAYTVEIAAQVYEVDASAPLGPIPPESYIVNIAESPDTYVVNWT